MRGNLAVPRLSEATYRRFRKEAMKDYESQYQRGVEECVKWVEDTSLMDFAYAASYPEPTRPYDMYLDKLLSDRVLGDYFQKFTSLREPNINAGDEYEIDKWLLEFFTGWREALMALWWNYRQKVADDD